MVRRSMKWFSVTLPAALPVVFSAALLSACGQGDPKAAENIAGSTTGSAAGSDTENHFMERRTMFTSLILA